MSEKPLRFRRIRHGPSSISEVQPGGAKHIVFDPLKSQKFQREAQITSCSGSAVGDGHLKSRPDPERALCGYLEPVPRGQFLGISS